MTDRPNIRMNFDPINFERAGVDSRHALEVVQPFVGHVHLKGVEAGEYCEFGVGDVDLSPVIQKLMDGGYTGSFSVYAARGGAVHTTTVDMSNTYLAWAARNFELNDLDPETNVRMRADVPSWLPRAARTGQPGC